MDRTEIEAFLSALGSRQEIIAKDCTGIWFVYKAHPPMHIWGYVPVDVTR